MKFLEIKCKMDLSKKLVLMNLKGLLDLSYSRPFLRLYF